MKSKRRIFLIGFMGSGKSTLGKCLAKKLNYKYIDCDDLIEKNEGRTISEIFKQSGEAYFRLLEQQTLSNIIKKENVVISTGGGLPCFHNNITTINQYGFSFFLDLSATALLGRLNNERAHRPLLATKHEDEILNWIKESLEKRKGFYIQADYCLNAEQTIAELADVILKKLSI